MSNCANCHHKVTDHDGDGCIYGRETSGPCGCPFDYHPNGTFNTRCLPVKEEGVPFCNAETRPDDPSFPHLHCTLERGHEGEWHSAAVGGSFDQPERYNWAVNRPVANPDRVKYEGAVCANANCAGSCPGCATPSSAHVIPLGARDGQVGGDHYRKFKIQPWDIWLEYGLDPWVAGVIKYVLRAGHKGSKLEDLRKARHYLDRTIEIEEGK